MPSQAGLGGKVVEVDRDRLCGGGRDNGFDIGHEPIIRNSLVIERRQDKRGGKAELSGMPCQCHGVGDRRRSSAHHEAIERQAVVAVGSHHPPALIERERGRLARGAEHIEAIASVREQEACEHAGARAIGLALLVDRRCDGGNYAGEVGFGHRVSPGSSRSDGVQQM
jgi:hypothetical protein